MTFCQESYPLEMKSDQWENRELTEEKLTVLVLLTKKCCWNDCYDIVSFLTLLPGPFSVIMSREIFTALILPNSLLWSFFFFWIQSRPYHQQASPSLIQVCDSTSQNILQILFKTLPCIEIYVQRTPELFITLFLLISNLNIQFCCNVQKHPTLDESNT